MGAGIVLLLVLPMAASFVIPCNTDIRSSCFRMPLASCLVRPPFALQSLHTRHRVAVHSPRCSLSPGEGMEWIDADSDLDSDGKSTRILIPSSIASRLSGAGIVRLTQVQAETYAPILEGQDVIARSRTGTGKTMAFALPLSQVLNAREGGKRGTSCLVILPTRELALQVRREFQLAAGKSISVVAAVGGSALEPLIQQLETPGAADVVVGTPGRIVECVRGGWLDLGNLHHLVVDEADQLLEGGFADEMQLIVDRARSGRKGLQTVLTCATMPPALRSLAQQLCVKPPVIVDLVGRSRNKQDKDISQSTVNHFSTPVVPASRPGVLRDLLSAHTPSNALVFTSTKLEAVELSQQLSHIWKGGGVDCLHGDLPQYQRTRVLEGFREGLCKVLIATDVAARGIHVNDLELVVHCGVPLTSSGASRRAKKDVASVINTEQFVHRTGRTGRMGGGGMNILMYDPTAGEAGLLGTLERALGIKFTHLDAPGRQELVEKGVRDVESKLRSVDASAIVAFSDSGKRLLAEMGPDALAAAIALLSGLDQIPPDRSLLCGKEGTLTVLASKASSDEDSSLSPTDVMSVVRSILPGFKLGRVSICEDGSAAFDLPSKEARMLVESFQQGGNADMPIGSFTLPTAMPVIAKKLRKEQ